MTGESLLGARLAKAASRLIGTRFLLHGRDPAKGLDCVGLVRECLLAIGCNPKAPEGYGLRNTDHSEWFDFAYQSGFFDVSGDCIAGDVIMLSPGPAQQHLMIVERQGIAIHAHAGLKRVVRQPIPWPNSSLAHWRLP